jgi:hypothetical protein
MGELIDFTIELKISFFLFIPPFKKAEETHACKFMGQRRHCDMSSL